MLRQDRFPRSTRRALMMVVVVGLGWAAREVAFARERAAQVESTTVNLDKVAMSEFQDGGKAVGKLGLYVSGDTPGSTKFVTGRFVLDPGKSPHAPHVHDEEEVMIIESGHGEIIVDGKSTKVGPGSVMYTTPRSSHWIVNTGNEPIVFYFIKWVGKPAQ